MTVPSVPKIIYYFFLLFVVGGASLRGDVPQLPRCRSTSLAFRALHPYYIQQKTGSSCSLATVTMVVNALVSRTIPPCIPVTQEEVLRKVHDKKWTKALAEGGSGVSLDQCGRIMKRALHVFGFDKMLVSVSHVSDIATSKNEYHKALHLLASRKKLRCLIIVNFDQAVLLPIEGPCGHFSPLGDYNPQTHKVLVMDVDKDWTGPYWVSRSALLKSLNTKDSTGHTYRGYIHILVGELA